MSEQLSLNNNWDQGKRIRIHELPLHFKLKERFKNEKAMCDYIESNIESFCSEILDDDYVSHVREKKIFYKRGTFAKGQPNSRLDFYIQCKQKYYAIEVKNPKHVFSEMTRAVGQMMMYQLFLEDQGNTAELVMVTSVHSDIFLRMLKRFGLNYRYIVFNKYRSAELIGYDG